MLFGLETGGGVNRRMRFLRCHRRYGKIVGGAVSVRVTFSDVIAYHGPEHAWFAGRETGSYTGGGAPVGLEIRTSRYFRYQDGRCRQYRHGSIDDPAAPPAYQQAIQG